MLMSKVKATLLTASVLTVGALVLVLFILLKSEPQENKLRVRLTWLHQAQFAGIYSAEDQGYYKSEGLDVSIYPGGIEYSSVKMVLTGTDDIGLTSADQILLARAKGVPLVALAAMYQRSPVVLFSLKKSGITRPEHLPGKKIGIKYGDNTEVPIRALLQKTGIKKGEYEEVSVSYDIAPLLDGRVDVLPGFALNEPLSLREKGYDVNLIYVADYGINFYADVIFTREDVLAKKKDSIDRFLRATLRGYEYALAHPNAAVASTKIRAPEAKEEHELAMLEVSASLWRPTTNSQLGKMELANWEAIQETLISTRVQDGTSLLKEQVDLNRFADVDALRRIK